MIQNKFPNVWYASEKKVKSTSKFIAFDDRGSLDISKTDICFVGKKNIKINKSTIKNISITKQKIPWISYLIMNVFIIFYFMFSGVNIFLLLPILIPLLIIFNILGLLIGSSTKWVLIEYFDQNKNIKKVYFANGSMLGWSGSFGGTQKIYNFIKS